MAICYAGGVNTRRRWTLLMLCLLAGAILNIAVAWGCALLSQTGTTSAQQMPENVAFALLAKYAGAELTWNSPYGMHWKNFGVEVLTVQADAQTGHSESPTSTALEVRYGWPALALCSGRWIPDTTKPQNMKVVQGVKVPPLPRLGYDGGYLPTSPLWRGMVINTLFYAAMVWMLIRGPFEAQRRWREWNGRCGACGYPRGTSSVCTECGADLTKGWWHNVAPADRKA